MSEPISIASLRHIRAGVRRVWKQYLSYEGPNGPVTETGFVRAVSPGSDQFVFITERGVEFDKTLYRSGQRAYPCLDMLPGKIQLLTKSHALLDSLVEHVTADIMAISRFRSLAIEVEGSAGTGFRRVLLPGKIDRGNLFGTIRNRLDIQNTAVAVMHFSMAFMLAAVTMRKLSVSSVCRAVRLVTENGGLDEDGLVMLVHESLTRLMHENWQATKPGQKFNLISLKQLEEHIQGRACFVEQTDSAGSYNVRLGSGEVVAHIDSYTSGDKTTLRLPNRDLIRTWGGSVNEIPRSDLANLNIRWA